MLAAPRLGCQSSPALGEVPGRRRRTCQTDRPIGAAARPAHPATEPTLKLTGERPIEGKTPDSLLALHEAGYREVLARVGAGTFLDVGCGLGDGSARFLGGGRRVVGVDYEPTAAAAARRAHADGGLVTACCDGARLALRAGSFDWVCSSHLIEHFTEPEGHVAEIARVLRDDGTAFFVTPNAPADFENPYHVHLFEPPELRETLGRHFRHVEVLGLDGTTAVKADFERRRRVARRLLALDVLDLRHRLPHRWYVGLHAAGRRLAYPLLARRADTGAAPLTAEEFFVTDHLDETTLVLLAVAAGPRR